jgi:hypothetical protein
MNVYCVLAVQHHAHRTGGIQINTWDQLSYCKHTDGSLIQEMNSLKKEWRNLMTHFPSTDVIPS